ncbi:MAG: SDR family NAD(P)-dependent oxidoreductase [Bacteroidetes bacterium]|jgi:NAD(P)-dependent dehydrogenase (short-subunit alcohol dehydrogenase family)|nr:SDR family NAD(P)-dependent oxidoreductase [Bacteroidota bacterium]
MPLSLTDRSTGQRAFVTGAASGLGLAFCRHLARDGWTIGMADVAVDRLDEAATEIRDLGGIPRTVHLDVTDADAFSKSAADFVEATGGIDLVINNAGLGAGGPFDETTAEQWRSVIGVNLLGVVNGCQAFIPHLKNGGGGHLMNVASIAAVAAAPRMSIYNVTKAGVRALSETLYAELSDDGIHVSVVMPSFFRTNIDRDLVGPESARSMTQALMDKSNLSADEVARHALDAVASEDIHVIYPSWMSRVIWYWKRLFPGHYVRGLVKREREAKAFAEKSS